MSKQLNPMSKAKREKGKETKDAKTLISFYADNSDLPIAMVSRSASQHTKNVILAIWKKECNDELSSEII